MVLTTPSLPPNCADTSALSPPSRSHPSTPTRADMSAPSQLTPQPHLSQKAGSCPRTPLSPPPDCADTSALSPPSRSHPSTPSGADMSASSQLASPLHLPQKAGSCPRTPLSLRTAPTCRRFPLRAAPTPAPPPEPTCRLHPSSPHNPISPKKRGHAPALLYPPLSGLRRHVGAFPLRAAPAPAPPPEPTCRLHPSSPPNPTSPKKRGHAPALLSPYGLRRHVGAFPLQLAPAPAPPPEPTCRLHPSSPPNPTSPKKAGSHPRTSHTNPSIPAISSSPHRGNPAIRTSPSAFRPLASGP
ncbi:hypothetical protein HNR46_000475 [Haloferula luteola]|uniref:Uncharacterized protein n=1 Tax=Haloferula luteola TaxID=595692 RepID=A0A840VBI5_9BACT|nr:hypothetical protein [Haloferula luteola]